MTAAVAPRRVGIDVGGTKALGIVLDATGAVVDEQRRATPRGDDSLDPLVDVLVELASSLAPSIGADDSVGIGVPGLVTRSGVLRAAPNLDGVADLDVRGRVAAAFDDARRPDVAVDNDATCATVAEWRLGAAVGSDHVMLITLGTGIGGGVVANGRVVRGVNGFAGEFGHMVVDPNGPRCPCGRRGCWERYASGSGLAMLAREAATGRRLQGVVEAAGGAQAVTGEHVRDAARTGDAEAIAVIDDFARWVALGLTNLTNAFDPEVLVLGGGLATGADLYLEPISRWYARLLYQPHLRPLPRIEFATWGDRAGAVGAALLPGLRSNPSPTGATEGS
ncbi:ROK family protein [Ilumatobacter sp.]|uniref:ROK family protein n=1 Tax=Ilumatobacter sp. TaxID=1967498 RepID=UPI003B51C6B6